MSLQAGINWGMLWFDNNPRVPFGTKVQEAAARYEAKYGRCPDLCYVNPRTAGAAEQIVARVQVVVMQQIQPDHFWLGVKTAVDRADRAAEGSAGSKSHRSRRS